MDLKWIQMGAREYHIRSLFKEDTWKLFFKRFPEIEEVSFIGVYGTWKQTMPGAEEHNRLEVYLIPNEEIQEVTKDEDWVKTLEHIFNFLSKHKLQPVPLEVKVETNYLDDFSGWVLRDGMTAPNHFWHHKGIQGFTTRVRLHAESERLLSMQSS